MLCRCCRFNNTLNRLYLKTKFLLATKTKKKKKPKMMVGGINPNIHDATEEIQSYCDQLKSKVEEKAGSKFDVYESKTYRHQLVAGTNYFVKVHVGNDNYIHLRIYRMLDNTLELTAVKLDQKDHHPLEYFQ